MASNLSGYQYRPLPALSTSNNTNDNNNNNNNSTEPPQEPKSPPTQTTTIAQPSTTLDQILLELRHLNEIQTKLATKPPLAREALWNSLLQLLALIFGSVFGAFAILAWQAATQANNLSTSALEIARQGNGLSSSANDLAKNANAMALVSYCQSGPAEVQSGMLCAQVQATASRNLASYASVYFTITAPASGTNMASPTRSASGTPAGPSEDGSNNAAAIGGIAAGAAVGLLALLGGAAWWQYSIYKAKQSQSLWIRKMVKSHDAASDL